MQHLENDMDDLFQRAAENYHLKNSADWESVAKKMEPENKLFATPAKTKKNRKVFPLLLLFIVSGSWFAWHELAMKNVHRNHLTALSKSIDNGLEQNNIHNKTATVFTNKQTRTKFLSNNKISIHKSLPAYPVNNLQSKASLHLHVIVEQKNLKNNGLKNNAMNSNISDFSVNEYFAEIPDYEFKKRLQINSIEILPVAENENKKSLEEKKTVNAGNKGIIKKASIKHRTNGFYAGVITALDFSKVKAGSFDNTGFDAGFLLGYTLNYKLSLETGFLLNKKIYSSAGKNFNMNKVRSTMPAGMIINNLESNSFLAEIPVRVKYNFIQKSKTNFFVTGGASAYIMTKEKNNYNVTLNGNNEKISGVYNTNNYGLPAVANVSVGYEHKISGLLNIRIEPFLKIPLQGIGVGKLPVTSAGLQIGITGHLK